MRYLITGMNGTVAPALARHLRSRGGEVIAWDRRTDPTDSEALARGCIERHRPDWVCHVATGAPEWAAWIARACAGTGPRLLWTGSVSVFGQEAVAPLLPTTVPDAADDYGRYKIDCEKRVLAANPDSVVARLGWQVGEAPGSNTMTDFLTKRAAEGGGKVEASTAWTPSCAWLPDSAEALAGLMDSGAPGLYHLEGNQAGMTFHEIASAINRRLGAGWTILPTDSPKQDNRMSDPRVRMGQLADMLR